MKALRSVMTVARVEAMLLRRSWVFRFLTLFAFLFLVLSSWVFFILDYTWMIKSIPSSYPYFVFLILTIFESLIVIFGAVDSSRRDQAMNVYQSLHARNITNLGYLTGKVIGIMKPCITMNMIFLVLAAVVNVVFMPSVPFVWTSYFFYLFLLNIPALLFITGLSFALTGAVKAKPLAMLILVGYFVAVFLYRDGIVAHVIDYIGLHLPLMSSSIVGLGDPAGVLFQRGFIVFLALGCIILSALFFERPPQSKTTIRFSPVFAAAFFAIALISGTLFVANIYGGIQLRKRIVGLNKEYVSKPRARLAVCDLDIEHKGSKIAATAKLTIRNDKQNPMESVYFSLNPGFTVRSVTSGGANLTFTRNTQILDVQLPSPLTPGSEATLTIAYDGAINDEACYPEIATAERIRPNRVFTYVIDKRYGFIVSDYILLTPECQWYPAPGIPNGLMFPESYERDFTDFSLDIATRDGLMVISQGVVEKTGVGTFTVRPETKLPGLSLAAGDYEKRSVEVDSVEVALYNLKGHFFFKTPVPIEPKTMAAALGSMKESYEFNKKMKYPYPRYCVVESPVQFHAYERPWKTYTETTQPQIAIVPELGFYLSRLRENMFDLQSQMDAYKRSGVQNIPPQEQLMANMVRGNLYDVFMSDRIQRETARTLRSRKPSVLDMEWIRNPFGNHYIPGLTISVQYYPYLSSFESEQYPVFNTIMEFYRKHGLNTNTTVTSRTSKPLFDEEIACMALERNSFEQYLADGTDFDTMNLLLMLKANHLFGALQAAIGTAGFDAFLNEYIKAHAFENVSYEQFSAEVESRFAFNMDEIFENWFSESRLPLFVVDNVSLTEILDGEHTCYQTMLRVTNTEPVPGMIWVQIRLQGSGNEIERATRFINLAGNQTREIGFVTSTPPPDMEVNGMISKNIPLIYSKSFKKPVQDFSMKPFEGERIVDYAPPTPGPGTIVVDNLDSGFEIISNPEDIDDGKKASMYQYGKAPNDFIAPVLNNPPKRWGKTVIPTAYGTQKVALYTKGGNGDGSVAWHAQIPEVGKYELEYYIYETSNAPATSIPAGAVVSNGQMVVRSKRADSGTPAGLTVVNGYLVMSQTNGNMFKDYNMKVTNAGQTDDISFLPKPDQPGWQFVGSFDLKPGMATVTLSNKSDGTLIYADAIRWVKK